MPPRSRTPGVRPTRCGDAACRGWRVPVYTLDDRTPHASSSAERDAPSSVQRRMRPPVVRLSRLRCDRLRPRWNAFCIARRVVAFVRFGSASASVSFLASCLWPLRRPLRRRGPRQCLLGVVLCVVAGLFSVVLCDVCSLVALLAPVALALSLRSPSALFALLALFALPALFALRRALPRSLSSRSLSSRSLSLSLSAPYTFSPRLLCVLVTLARSAPSMRSLHALFLSSLHALSLHAFGAFSLSPFLSLSLRRRCAFFLSLAAPSMRSLSYASQQQRVFSFQPLGVVRRKPRQNCGRIAAEQRQTPTNPPAQGTQGRGHHMLTGRRGHAQNTPLT